MGFDLADFEKRLNEDPNLQADFMKDPASVIQKEGLNLSPKMKQNLERFVREMQDPKFSSSGSSTANEGGVLISIGKSF